MNILKKILGIIILLFTILLSCAFLYALTGTFLSMKRKIEAGESGVYGYVIGYILALCLSILVVYFLTRVSLKLLRNKKNSIISSIDEIGT